MKFNIALLHYSCPPVVGGVEEIIRQQASLFKRFYHNVKVFSGDGVAFSKHIDVEINPLLGSRDHRVMAAHHLSREGHTDTLERLIGEIYRYLVHSLEGFDLLIAEYVFPSGECLTADRIIIRDLYLIADMLFLPSLQEGFGIPILESGMIKLPVACSNIPPFLEIGGQDVCVFDHQDPPAEIACKILFFIDELKPHKLFRKVIRKYVWDNIYSNKILPLLEHVVGLP